MQVFEEPVPDTPSSWILGVNQLISALQRCNALLIRDWVGWEQAERCVQEQRGYPFPATLHEFPLFIKATIAT